MVYSTCTINKKENELMIKQFLEKYQDMKIVEEKRFYHIFMIVMDFICVN